MEEGLQERRQTQQQLEKLLEDGGKASEAEIQSPQEALCTRQVFNHCLFIIVEFACSGELKLFLFRVEAKSKIQRRRRVSGDGGAPKELPPRRASTFPLIDLNNNLKLVFMNSPAFPVVTLREPRYFRDIRLCKL